MKQAFTATIISRINSGHCTDKVKDYLSKGYKIETIDQLHRFEDGSLTVRFGLELNEEDLNYSPPLLILKEN